MSGRSGLGVVLASFGRDGPLQLAVEDYEQRLATWREWEQTSIEAQG